MGVTFSVITFVIGYVFSDWLLRKRIAPPLSISSDDITAYLDECITFWRKQRDDGSDIAEYYVDTYQSARLSLVGELLADSKHNSGFRMPSALPDGGKITNYSFD